MSTPSLPVAVAVYTPTGPELYAAAAAIAAAIATVLPDPAAVRVALDDPLGRPSFAVLGDPDSVAAAKARVGSVAALVARAAAG